MPLNCALRYLASTSGLGSTIRSFGGKGNFMQVSPRFPRLGLAIALVIGGVAQAQGLICSTEFAAGLSFNKSSKKWESTTFRAESKFVVVRSESPYWNWEVRALGSKSPVAICKDDFSEREQLMCAGLGKEFYFNKGSMRFLLLYMAGFWNEESLKGAMPGHSEGDDTPSISGGFCTSL